MAFNYTQNKKNYTVILHATANSEAVLVGNNSVSNVAIGDEIIESATIRQVWYGSSSGDTAGGALWTVDRDGTTVATFDSTGWTDFSGNGHELDIESAAANVGVTITGGNLNGYIMMEIRKNVALPANTNGY
jgi:hypothetical protein